MPKPNNRQTPIKLDQDKIHLVQVCCRNRFMTHGKFYMNQQKGKEVGGTDIQTDTKT